MKVGVITESVPHLFHGGGDLTAFAVVRSLRAAGHEVHLLALNSSGTGAKDHAAAQLREFNETGVPASVLPSSQRVSLVRRILELRTAFPISLAFPALLARGRVRQWISTFSPDVIFCYHWGPAAAVFGTHSCPTVIGVGDPADLPVRFRKEFAAMRAGSDRGRRSMRQRLEEKVLPLLQRSGMKRLLEDATRCGAFAAHHARELSSPRVRCEYFRTPIADPGERPATTPSPNKLRVLHIGHLKGIATLTGIESLAHEIIPQIEAQLPPAGLEVRIVGGFHESLPDDLKSALQRPSVTIVGPVYPADEELENADIVIVPTPIELGIRVRILTAMAHSCCIVAHRANALGIPELVSGENCILGGSAKELADACIRLGNSRTLSDTLRQNARATYIKYFSMDEAGGALTDVIESAAGLNQGFNA